MTDAAWLRSLPTLTGDAPALHLVNVPDDPIALFRNWIAVAAEHGIPEPHAMTLATADADGRPAARVVLLTDVADGAWVFSTDARAGKAHDLAANPRAALTFYWQPLGRQVRVAGAVRLLDPEECAADFLRRSPSARAAALASRPGEPLRSVEDMVAAVGEARARVDRDPRLVPSTWQLWAVEADEVELWQGDHDRAHLRVRYSRDGDRWDRRLDWP